VVYFRTLAIRNAKLNPELNGRIFEGCLSQGLMSIHKLKNIIDVLHCVYDHDLLDSGQGAYILSVDQVL
jgi:hypothetical protein